MQHIVEELKTVYRDLSGETVEDLIPLYHEDIDFIDPVNHIHGRQQLIDHFHDVYRDIAACAFVFHSKNETILSNHAYLHWTMSYKHRRLNQGGLIKLDGISLVKFDQQITYHQDWFDMGALVYEHVPLLGALVRKIKSNIRVS